MKDPFDRPSTWRRAARCDGLQNCVELYHVGLPTTRVAVRDGKNPRGGVITLTDATWRHLRAALDDGTRVT